MYKNCEAFFKGLSKETTVHGVRYLVLKHTHPAEKLFWFAMLFIALYTTTSLCVDQWNRYVQDPTVVTVEKDWRSWKIPNPGLTYCNTEQADDGLVAKLIEQVWGANITHEKFPYYYDYVRAVSRSPLNNLSKYIPFKNDEELEKISMLDIAFSVINGTTFAYSNASKNADKYKNVTIITERGLCYNFFSIISQIALCRNYSRHINYTDLYSFETYKEGKISIAPALSVEIYFHSPYDIITGDMQPNDIIESNKIEHSLNFLWARTSPKVGSLRVDQRRCKFLYEPHDDIVPFHSRGICEMSCRAKQALQLCGCRPYVYHFYNYGNVCNATGMACLAENKNWTIFHNHNCDCLPNCVDIFYTIQDLENFGVIRYTTGTHTTQLVIPRVRYVLNVLFTFDYLIVSFGGAAALYLGCSFLSIVDTLFYIICFILKLCFKNNFKPKH